MLTSVGVGEARIGDSDAEYGTSLALQADFAYRLNHVAAIGVHAGIGSAATYGVADFRAMFDQGWDYSYRPLELGISAQLALGHHTVLAPWIGMQNGIEQQECHWYYDKTVGGGMYTEDCTAGEWHFDATANLALGISFAVDAWSFGDGSRVSIVGSAMAAKGDEGDETYDDAGPYRAVWLGVGYRFWPR